MGFEVHGSFFFYPQKYQSKKGQSFKNLKFGCQVEVSNKIPRVSCIFSTFLLKWWLVWWSYLVISQSCLQLPWNMLRGLQEIYSLFMHPQVQANGQQQQMNKINMQTWDSLSSMEEYKGVIIRPILQSRQLISIQQALRTNHVDLQTIQNQNNKK